MIHLRSLSLTLFVIACVLFTLGAIPLRWTNASYGRLVAAGLAFLSAAFIFRARGF